MPIKIRKFRKDDAHKLSYLSRKCIALINSKNMSEQEAAILYKSLTPGFFIANSQKHVVYIAEHNGKVIGTGTMDENHVRAVFVNPCYHCRGIGKKLMQKIEREIIKNSFQFATLTASVFAENFYKKLGYKKIKKIHGEVGILIVMEKYFS